MKTLTRTIATAIRPRPPGATKIFRTRKVFRRRVAYVTLTLLAVTGTASAIPASNLTAEEAQEIAREAYLYGLPLVETYANLYGNAIDEGGSQYKAPFNALSHETPTFEPEDRRGKTPNLDVAQSYIWMDLRAEPVVLSVPEIEPGRYYSIQLIDLYTFNFAYLGTRTTGNGPGRYMVVGPRWQGAQPDGVTVVIRSETDFALAIYRTEVFGVEDLENVERIQSSYGARTASEFLGRPAPPPAAEIAFPRPDPKARDGLGLFASLDFLLQFCPTVSSEEDLRARFARIGAAPGERFDASKWNPELRKALESGVEEARAAIEAAGPNAKPAEIFGSRAQLEDDWLERAVGARVGLYGSSKEETLSPLYVNDAEGKPLDASQRDYVLNLSGQNLPPVDAFWSITVYDGVSQGLVANPLGRYRISSRMLEGLALDAAGGLSLYIQHESPGPEKEVNWLPAPAGPFYMVMRLYWPKPEAFAGSWRPPIVWAEKPSEEVKPTVLSEAPMPELERPTVWGEPTEVRISIYVIDVDEVNSARQNFAASVYYEARWHSPFLRHKGPGPLQRSVTEVWWPRLVVVGQQMAVTAFPQAVEIHPDGEVVYRQKVWGTFSQPLDLRNFPLDRQTLTLHIAAVGLLEEHVKLVPLERADGRKSAIAATFSVPDFDILSWSAETAPYFPLEGEVGTAGFRMQIEVERRIAYFVMKIIVPLCLIVIMSWLPRWIDPEQIGTNIGISTTAFLTLVAYLFAITVLLPRVSYITRMDRFILLSTLMVFLSLIQTVANTALLRSGRTGRVARIERWSRILYPVTLVIVLLVSFAG